MSPYCRTLPVRWPAVALLSSGASSNVFSAETAYDAVRAIRDATPPAIAPAWAAIAEPLDRAAAALSRAGATWDDLVAADRERTVPKAARQAFGTAVDRLRAGRARIERAAAAHCGVALGDQSELLEILESVGPAPAGPD